MDDELKPCPFCGKQPQGNNWHAYGRNPKDEMRYFCTTVGCPNALRKAITKEEWNTRPLEDALQAEVDRLRAIVRKLEWSVVASDGWEKCCPICRGKRKNGHYEDCPLHKWEGGE